MKDSNETTSDLYYVTKEGYRVFTEKYHLQRGYCCKSACKHCPYGYEVKTNSLTSKKNKL